MLALPYVYQLLSSFRYLFARHASWRVFCLVILDMALQFAQRQDCPLILVLDAFFAVGPVFTRAASLWSLALKQPSVHILTRAKKHYVAYHEPVPATIRARGRPWQYGPPSN